MSFSAVERLNRHHKLSRLSDVVLLSSRSAEPHQKQLEGMIQKRVYKEFPEPSSEEEEILAGIAEKNLHFCGRTIKQHNNQEFFTQINENVREKDVHLFHKFQDPNVDLVELLVIGDNLKRAGVKSTTLYVPFLPYMRQDKKDDGRVPITASGLFDWLFASMGQRLKRIVTFDLHAQQEQGYFDGPLDELSAIPEFAAYYREKLKDSFKGEEKQVIVFAADAGGAKKAKKLARLLDTQYQVFDKDRLAHGRAETKQLLGLDLSEKKAIIVEDMIDSGGSLVGEYETGKNGPVQNLQELGAEVYICATHAILSRKNSISAEERFRRAGVPVLFTDSIPERHEGYYQENKDWMNIFSLDYTLAKAFYCNQVGESISAFLRNREERLKVKDMNFILQNGEGGQVYVE